MHTLLRILSIVSSLAAIPLAASMSKTIAKLVGPKIAEMAEGVQLPALTRLWVFQIVNSYQITVIALVLTVIFGIALIKVWRLPKDSASHITGLIFVPSLAFVSALLMVMITLVAIILPWVEQIVIIGN